MNIPNWFRIHFITGNFKWLIILLLKLPVTVVAVFLSSFPSSISSIPSYFPVDALLSIFSFVLKYAFSSLLQYLQWLILTADNHVYMAGHYAPCKYFKPFLFLAILKTFINSSLYSFLVNTSIQCTVAKLMKYILLLSQNLYLRLMF